jgi:type II secretory ATPase GspE/PulE/Tfp pilus assembly ATPase PilB-like protein
MPEMSSLYDPTIASLLAALPTEGGYFSPFRIVVFVLAVLLWAYCSTWVDADTKKVRMPQGLWSGLTFCAGLAANLLWLFLPNFWIGLLMYCVLYGSMLITYVVLRNKRVGPTQTVLTLAHLQRLSRGGAGEVKAKDSQDRTRIKDATGKTPAWPTDPEQHAGYQALQDLLFDAIWRRTSDVRVDLTPNEPVKVVYRVDGVDRAREPIDAHLGPMMFSHMKRIAGLKTDEHRRPQNGQFKASIGAGGKGDRSVQVDVRTSGSTAGERILLRLISEEGKFRLSDIGLTKEQLAVMQKIVAEPKGVLLISGPKQSGVTSTLYAAMRQHDAFIQNIHTLEISKNMDLENITQNVFDSQGGTVSFGKRFRTVLRTEPDIVMAGDVPDAETAQLAAGAGKQGKKLYLGMTSKDTFHALRQYLQAVNDNALAAGSLLGVTSQRLVRLLCTNCRRAYKPDPALLKKGNLPTGENRPFYRPPNPNEVEVDKRGEPMICQICQGSGYLGRTGVFEVLVFDDELRNMIIRGEELAVVKAAARKRGMLYLQEVALYKVYEGLTSINEVLRVTKEAAPAAATA